MVVDGQEVADWEVRQTYRLTFEGDRYAIQIGGRTRWKGVYTIRDAANPKEMDITPADGEDAGKTFLGIYEAKRGVLTVCARERERPVRFFGEDDRAGLRIVLKRELP